jgi:tetratricopeptide (TPR) repeat protein
MSGNQEHFQQAMNQGHSAAWDQAWDKAAQFYRQALVEFPDNPKALTNLGLALFEMQQYEDALSQYQSAARRTPNDPVPLEKVAEILERLGSLPQATKAYMEVAELYARNRELDKAIENWSSVISLTPEHLNAHSRLALVYERMGRKQQAIMEYIAIASLFQHNGDVPKAVQTVNHLLQVFPDSNEAKQALSMIQSGKALPKPQRPRGVTGPLVMAQVRQLDQPKDDEDRSRPKMDPIQEARQTALTMLAGLLFEPNPEPEAPQVRQGLQALVKGTSILGISQVDQTKIMLHLSQAIDLQSRGQDAQAVVELDRAIDSGLESPAAFYDMGLLLSKGDRQESAVRNLQRAVKHTDFALGARILLGQIQNKLGRIKEASIEYLEALRIADTQSIEPEYAEELFQIYDPVIEAFSQQSDKNVQTRLCENIEKMLLRNDWREHVKHARKQLPPQTSKSTPMALAEILTEASSSQVVESLSKVHDLARAGKLRTAMEEAFHALQYAPTYLPLHITIGDLLFQENRVPEAVLKYTVIAESYSARGEAHRAIAVLRKVSDLSPLDMEARNRLIDLMIERGDTDETVEEFTRLAEAYYGLADLVTARKTYTRALRYAQQINIDRTTKVEILHRMADIDMQSLDWRQALRVFEQVRTLEPDDEKSRTMLIDLNLRLNQAVQALAELDNYIAFLLNAGHSKKALDFLTVLVQENAKQPAMHRRLGELYRQLGRNDDAVQQLDLAADLFMQAGNRQAAIETLIAILALNPADAPGYQQLLSQLQKER